MISNAAGGDPARTARVVELRQYTLRPGQREDLIELFERELIEPQERPRHQRCAFAATAVQPLRSAEAQIPELLGAGERGDQP
jgi:hypothetical protein